MPDLDKIATDMTRAHLELLRNADGSFVAELAAETDAPMLTGRELDDIAELLTAIADRLLATLDT